MSKDKDNKMTTTLDDLSRFEAAISHAKATHTEWVETSKDIIKYFMPQGTGDAGYFCYKGIKVCEPGKVDEIEEKMNMSLAHKFHGPTEGVLVKN